jgi:hypothetical protein
MPSNVSLLQRDIAAVSLFGLFGPLYADESVRLDDDCIRITGPCPPVAVERPMLPIENRFCMARVCMGAQGD